MVKAGQMDAWRSVSIQAPCFCTGEMVSKTLPVSGGELGFTSAARFLLARMLCVVAIATGH